MTITEHLINHLMYNTLTVGIYGMIESKKKHIDRQDPESGFTPTEEAAAKKTPGADSKGRVRELEKENKKLKALIEKERAKANEQSACCTIF